MIKAMVEEIAQYRKKRENIEEQLEKYRNIEKYYCLYEKMESEAEKGNSKQCVAIGWYFERYNRIRKLKMIFSILK